MSNQDVGMLSVRRERECVMNRVWAVALRLEQGGGIQRLIECEDEERLDSLETLGSTGTGMLG